MRTCDRRLNWCWSAGFALVLAGCGQRETPKAAGGGASPAETTAASQTGESKPAVEPETPAAKAAAAKTAEQAPAKPAGPASLEEATRVIDFRKFPMPDGETAVNKSSVILTYQLQKVDGEQAMQFYRAKFAETGWKFDGEEYVDKEKGYFRYSWTKQGFFMSGGAHKDPTSGAWSVYITNHGNIDSRTLPRLAATELKHPVFTSTYYHTNAKPEEVAEFMRAELTKAGWREVEPRGGKRKRQPDDYLYVRFIRKGSSVSAQTRIAKGHTTVMLSVGVLRVELPIMPETNGVVEFMDADVLPVHLFYSTPAAPDKVLDFHRKELPALGWTIREGTDTIADGKAKVFLLDAPGKEPLRLELLALKDDTFVLITDAPERKSAKPKAKSKGPSAKLVTEKELRFEGKLTKDSPKVQNSPAEIHKVSMSPGKTYVIDLESTNFDAYLRILDANGKELAKDDDSGDDRNSRLRFTPPKDGEYQVVASVFGAGSGSYVLKIQVSREEKQP